ncbi:MAG: aminotransferase class I/II-fold pyridoxal phosphate-dependent enzyme, partial [Magnetospirillum sp.]|nr:aminotransferase class I/II-fold pyridoxal phosphate-dependent enzyme [Magnetospirillum sp.]
MPAANSVFAACGTTIFETMSRLAQAHGAVNLGQGFPEGLEPRAVIDQAAAAVSAGPHQYPSMMGIPALRQAVAAHECRFWNTGVAEAEVMVTSGATEALAACLFALIEPGDEVVVLEPLYDSYLPIIRRAGGIPRIVRLEAPTWALPRQQLADAFGPKTKLMVLNSPANPCGKVFDADELAFIADLLIRHDCLAVCDEVYEHLTYDGRQHVPLMSLPGMRERCAKVGS